MTASTAAVHDAARGSIARRAMVAALLVVALVTASASARAQERAPKRAQERVTTRAQEKEQEPDTARTTVNLGSAGAPFTRELWLHALRQEPSVGAAAFGVTLEGIYHFAARAHDRWRRNAQAEVLARPAAWLRVELGYDPESALITGRGGVHFVAEGSMVLSDRYGAGAYARYDRAVSELDAVVGDIELGAHVSIWSHERRTYINEKVGYRYVSNEGFLPGVDDGAFLQIRHHLVYVPSEDWSLTFVQEGSGRIGIGSDPHTNALRIENLFLLSPTMLFSVGPMVGVSLDYFVGPATSALSVPVGARIEAHPGRVVIAVAGSYDVATISGQRTAGLLLRGSAGIRF
ncbi:MAG TPA: hypothetical protein VNA88_02615 [Candidatus Kapabacteria bacterium]|nr:hypothetical protein [Candidatus Kapabacteria bacterium]